MPILQRNIDLTHIQLTLCTITVALPHFVLVAFSLFDEAKTVAGAGFLGPKTLLKKIKKRLNCSATQKVRKNSDSFLYQKPISFVAHFAFEEFPHEYVIALRRAPNTTHI